MNEKLPLEASINEIINRISFISNKYNITELKIDWIKDGYGFSYNRRKTEIIDFENGFKSLVQEGYITLVDQNRIRLRPMLSESKLRKGDILMNSKKESDKTKVFIVHGHDELAKTEVARFIEKLGLSPIILHEQASGGKTIIEKIEEYSNVGFGIVLYTQCDVGAKKSDKDNLQFRARQNVVFEHGFLMGKIGRGNVAALVKDEVEKPNDISGVVYITMDPYKGWNMELIKELRNSGYQIDMSRL
ncbi:nucleotide-binding protein [Peribacillus frigoritolerans]|uniref:nucleotide-binding protein n=1 Tax=Peribacillus frigoritolerans TaxID=450367 RepID=UPI0025A0B249|nr:nucleotide-binding protein [Peribacillus frigoritolerans]MDM5306357.1 nucleotide-binding protein [Peribacillus frigoritolerans]